MIMAAFMGMLMMFCIMNVLVLMRLAVVIMSMDVIISGMATHIIHLRFLILHNIISQV